MNETNTEIDNFLKTKRVFSLLISLFLKDRIAEKALKLALL